MGSVLPRILFFIPIFILYVLSTTLIALGGRGVNYVHRQYRDNHNFITIQYPVWSTQSQSWQQQTANMNYLPLHFSQGQDYAYIAAGAIGIFFSTIAGVMCLYHWTPKTCTVNGSGKKTRSYTLSAFPWMAICTAILTITYLAVTIYAWKQTNANDLYFQNDLISSTLPTSQNTYQSTATFSMEEWNCLIAPYVQDTADVNSYKIRQLCGEGKAARYIMLPCVIIGGLVWLAAMVLWRRFNSASDAAHVGAMERYDSDCTLEAGGEEKDVEGGTGIVH